MNEQRALIPKVPGDLAPVSRLAERTLAERQERALVVPRTLIVGEGGYATISEAVDAARDGDTVLVRPGRYEESVLVGAKAITILGDGGRDEIVVGWDKGPAFTFNGSTARLAGLTIVGGMVDMTSGPPVVPGAALRVRGGAPTLVSLTVTQGMGVVFEAGASGSLCRSQVIGAKRWGILIFDGASPRIVDNEIMGCPGIGVGVHGVGSNARIDGNRVHDCGWGGIVIEDGASPSVERNDVWAVPQMGGIDVRRPGTDPLIRENRIHDTSFGITATQGASPRIEGNEIWSTRLSGVLVRDPDSNPVIYANVVRDSGDRGIYVVGGASARVENNRVQAGSKYGISVLGAGSDVLVRANQIQDGGPGIVIEGTVQVEDNEIRGARTAGIMVYGPGSAHVRANRVGDSDGWGILVTRAATARVEGNEIRRTRWPGIGVTGEGTSPMVTGNTIASSGDHGIEVGLGASAVIVGNTVLDAEEPAIWLDN
ncbi:MAG: right-handed parallel beta-helix repeat-containing protein [Chloroflexota bacterium]